MKFGTVTLVIGARRKAWAVEAQPHVLMRMKRAFGKVDKHKAGSILISDTPENCRDIEWFCQRYPMEVHEAAYLGEQAEAHRQQSEVIAAILSGECKPRPFELAVPARDYQKVAAEMWLRVGGLLLADDVGVGKTCSAICGLVDPATRPALVVTLTHLPRQWEAEIKKFAPSLSVHIAKKASPYDVGATTKRKARQLELIQPSFPDVIVMNYHKLYGWADYLAPLIKSVIFDEVQELRHTDTAKYSGAKKVAESATFRIGLSATPIYNFGGEFHSVVNLLKPDALGEHSEFVREWCVGGGDKPRVKEPKAFGTFLREQGIMLRRTRADVKRELPPLSIVPHYVDADTSALDKVESRAAELARLILNNNPQVAGDKWRASEELSHLVRQATGIAKAPYVADFVHMLIESGEQVVLYGWHHEFYRICAERLDDHHPVRFTGQESIPQKEAAKQAFIRGDSKVLLMSLRAGAGLDGLQGHCRTVVFGELDWSPGVHEQAIGRVYRDGQPDPVCAYYLVAESGSDPIIADTLDLKKQQIGGVRDPYADVVQKQADTDHVKRLAASILGQSPTQQQQATAA